MFTTYAGSHRGSAMACFIDERVMGVSGYDEMTSHPVLTEGAALIGRRVFVWDDHGFIGVERFRTVAEARIVYDDYAAEYDGTDKDEFSAVVDDLT